MRQDETEWAIGAIAWPKFPRAAGTIVFLSLVSIFGFDIDSNFVFAATAWTWGLFTLWRFLMPDVFMRNVWHIVGIPVKALGAWPIFWSLTALLVLLGTVRGTAIDDLLVILPLYFSAWLIEKVWL